MAEHVFGGLTLTFCIASALIGVPSLIRKFKVEKRCGMTLINILITFGMLISRIGYAICIGAGYMIFPDILGAVLFIVILVQYFQYHPARVAHIEGERFKSG